MNELIGVGIFLAAIVGGLLAFAPRLSEFLVRSRARRLPPTLSERMREEWLAELYALPGRASQLAFAIALTLTRRRSFAIEDESLFAASTRSPITVASFGGWPSVVLFTTVVVAAIAFAASFLIQPLYRSHTRVLLVPQRIPVRFVETTAHITLDERIRASSSVLLSRDRLEKLIREFDLYRSDRGRVPPSDRPPVNDAAIERMRRDITVAVDPGGQSFEVAYVSPNPRTAMIVTDRLAGLFIESHQRDRKEISRSAEQFLDDQIKDVRSRLLQGTDAARSSPMSGSDFDMYALTRESLKATYRDLLMKKEHARLSASVEQVRMGEQFKVIDGARLPEVPVSPDRTRITFFGAVVGFCLGVTMMMAGREGSLRRPKKLVAQS